MSSITDLPAGGSSRRGWLKKLGGVLGGGFLLGRSQNAAAGTQGVVSTQGLEPFLSEIMLVSFNFAPKGWALCNGQLLPINQNQALFALLGTRYGGNGQTNFALPNLRGRVVAHIGEGIELGQQGGTESHVLTADQIPPHMHGIKASAAIGTTNLSGISLPATAHHYVANNGGGSPQYGGGINTQLASSTSVAPPINVSSATGGSQAHENRQPFLCLNYIIALQGVFPSPD